MNPVILQPGEGERIAAGASTAVMKATAETVGEPPPREPTPEGFISAKRHELAVIAAQREALLDARDNGTFDADVLEYALANLDASQIAIEMRGGPEG